MNSWQRWIQVPQTHWFRRALFQIHLWTGISCGLYVLLISISGSALLLQSQVIRTFSPNQVDPMGAEAYKGMELKALIVEVYSDYEVYFVLPSNTPERATYVVLNKDEGVFPRYFNQYSGEDLGASNPWQIRTVDWLANVHDDLLMGRDGRKLNGIGGGVFLLMAFSGLTIWWRGRKRWKDSLQIKRNNPRGFNWQLHNFIGFWTILLMFSWGLSGIYLGFPRQLSYVLNGFENSLNGFRPSGGVLSLTMDIHFARFGEGDWSRWLWAVLALLPSVMVISGMIIWWKRVVMKKF